jgi:hypothetical protein
MSMMMNMTMKWRKQVKTKWVNREVLIYSLIQNQNKKFYLQKVSYKKRKEMDQIVRFSQKLQFWILQIFNIMDKEWVKKVFKEVVE